MHLGIYRFDGDPDELLAAYERVTTTMSADNSALHICVRRSDGITIYDTCPSREVFENFSAGAAFRAALAAAGLPVPAVQGEAVYEARVRRQRI
jgi:hypothetical protein